MKLNLSGKTALITGSTAGVGFKIAQYLASSGANIVVNGRKTEAVGSAVESLRQLAPQVSVAGIACDVGTSTGVAELVSAVPRADIVINNIGIYESKDFLDTSDEEWLHYFEVIVLSAVRVSRAYLPGMMKNYWGRLLYISSEWALNVPADMIPYGLAKSAILSLSQGLSKRLCVSGVTVNSILLGPVRNSYDRDLLHATADRCLTMEETIAARENDCGISTLAFPHVATEDEVANAALFLCSSLAQAQTGSLIHLDGSMRFPVPTTALAR